MLGKEIRLRRLFNQESHRLLAVTVDHAIARGVLRGLEDIRSTIEKVVSGDPDCITMHKGIAEKAFMPFVGRGSLGFILKCSSFSPYQPTLDTWVTDVEEAVRLGADAVSMGCIVGGDDQPAQIRNLALMAKQAYAFGMPLVAHIYPRGEQVADPYDWEAVRYAVRVGAELGVDIVKTNYTGSPETFEKVVGASPAHVVVAGGESPKSIEAFFQMTRDAMDAGAAGVTYGRTVWQHENPAAVIRALRVLIHEDGTVREAMEVLQAEMNA